MGKLTPVQIDEYFEKHLPYRTGILLAHYRMTRQSWTGDSGRLNACFVAALVTGRLFLNVLGIGKQSGVLDRFLPRSDDVTVDDLGGILIDPVGGTGAIPQFPEHGRQGSGALHDTNKPRVD